MTKATDAVVGKKGVETGDHFKNGASPKSLMSRGNFLFYFVSAVLVVATAFSSCKNNDDDKGKTFIVTFESNGGSSVEAKIVKDGEKVTKPSPNPTKEGYIFAEWFKEETLTTEWKFDIDVVTADTKLYAKWTPEEEPTIPQTVKDFILNVDFLPEPPEEFLPTAETIGSAYSKTEDDKEWRCETKKYSASKNPDDFFMFDPLASVLWPGCLVQGNSISSGVPTGIFTSKRNPGVVSLAIVSGDQGGVDNEYFRTIDKMQQSQVNQAMNEILAGYGGNAPAKYIVDIDFVESASDFNFKLNGGYSGGPVKMSAAFGINWTENKTRMLVKLHQQYFTMVYDDPVDGINGIFTPDITLDDVKNYTGPGNPICYISSVTYGRVYYLVYESSASKQELDAALKFSLYKFNTSTEAEYNKVMTQTTARVMQIGGNAADGLNSVTAPDLKTIQNFLDNGANFSPQNPGAPISYTIKYLKDASLVRMNNTMEYEAPECEVVGVEKTTLNIKINDYTVTATHSGNYRWCKNYLGIDIGEINNNTGGTTMIARHPENETYQYYGNSKNSNYAINLDAGKVQVSKENTLFIRFRTYNEVCHQECFIFCADYSGSCSNERTIKFDYNPQTGKWEPLDNSYNMNTYTFVLPNQNTFVITNKVNYSISID